MNLGSVVILLQWRISVGELDQSRIIHYEGDRETKVADIFSTMYSSVEKIIGYAEEEKWKNPIFYVSMLMRWEMDQAD